MSSIKLDCNCVPCLLRQEKFVGPSKKLLKENENVHSGVILVVVVVVVVVAVVVSFCVKLDILETGPT